MRPPARIVPLVAAVALALAASGCGGGEDPVVETPVAPPIPVAALPVAVTAAAPGGAVEPGGKTPKDVRRALGGNRVVVIGFVLDGPADDGSVAGALGEISTRRAGDARFFIYRVGRDRFGDLAEVLGVTGTPSVAVIGRDRKLTNLWTGLVDSQILDQSISDAADTTPVKRGAAG